MSSFDQDRYPAPDQQRKTTPVNRKQWDKGGGRDARPAVQRPPPSPRETGLALTGQDTQLQKKQKLMNERQQEYNDMLAKNPQRQKRRPKTPAGSTLLLGGYEDKRKALEKERNEEMKQELAKQANKKGRHIITPEQGMFIGPDQAQRTEQERLKNQQNQRALEKKQQVLQDEYNRGLAEDQRLAADLARNAGGQNIDHDRQRQLGEERRREYQDFLAQQQQKQRRAPEVGSGATLPVGEYDDSKRQKLFEERHNEYLQLQQQKLDTDRLRGLPPKPATPNHFFKNIGQHDRTAQALNEERKKEYNQKLAEQRFRTRGELGQGADENVTSIPSLRQHDSAELRKVKARNEEYKVFLEEKKQKDQHRLDHKKPPTAQRPGVTENPQGQEYATLPGLKYSESAEMRKVKERNKEYNEYMQQKGPPGPRRGWQTPTYEEILEQKRRESLRQDGRLKSYASDGALNNIQADLRARELDQEFDGRKNRYEESRKYGGILDDDNWLDPRRREQEYQTLRPTQAEVETDQIAKIKEVERPVVEEREDMAARVQNPYLGGLPIGHDERDSAKRRKQSDYRRELQLQIEEEAARRKREKVQELRVNASGLLNPETKSNRMKGLGGEPRVSPRREYKANEVQRYHSKFLDDDSEDVDAVGRPVRDQGPSLTTKPRSNYNIEPLGRYNVGGLPSGDNLRLDLDGVGGGGLDRGRRRDRDLNILDSGFTGLLQSRRNVGATIPAGLQYQPSTFVTAGGPGIGVPHSSVEDAYNFYGMQNILDAGSGGGGGGGLGLNLGGNDYGGPGGSPTPRVTFADNPQVSHRRGRDRSGDRISAYQFDDPNSQRSRSRQESQSYQHDLERQIQEKRYKKQMEREEQMRYDKKLEQEIKDYNPFGRSGGGAPIKDATGQAIADLRSLARGPNDVTPRRERVSQGSPTLSSPRPPPPRDDLFEAPPLQQNAVGETTYARGGHGIFGMPKTEAEKDTADKYKDELRQQIADKRRREQMEKEKERMEEEKENRRLEEQRVRMQNDYDEEQKKIKAREEETRKKNEELKRQAEERKKEQDRQRMEADDARVREQQAQMERERQERQQQQQPQQQQQEPVVIPQYNYYQYQQPGVRPIERQDSSGDVLGQLSSMRKKLESERRRVENQLENQRNSPDVFDARLIQRPIPPQPVGAFDKAVNKNPSLPPPRPDTVDMDLANAKNLQEFSYLKNNGDTDSRLRFRAGHPDAPITNKALETQQESLLRQQEATLRAIRDGHPFEEAGPSQTSIGRQGNASARSHLPASSAFIDVDGVNHFPDDFEDIPRRNDSARSRRRGKYPSSPRPDMGSQASLGLDVDRIQRKNDERMRRLQNLNNPGDDYSMADPDEVLENFMRKQRHNRPSSSDTQIDDRWMRPSSKPY